MSTLDLLHPPEEVLLGFARALRAAGITVTADRERTYLEAVAAVGLDDQPAVYHAGRATLCASPADLERYDQVYAAWFSGSRAGTKSRPPLPDVVSQAGLGDRDDRSSEGVDEPDAVRAQASTAEVLRHRDVATLDRREREDLARLFAMLRPRAPKRPRRFHADIGCTSTPAARRRSIRLSVAN